jgi:hypothetical protein
MRCLLLLVVLCLSACSNVAGKPLPMVEKGDPVWQLVPDRLAAGELPQ